MQVFNHQDFDLHEQVLYCSDRASGLSAIIAIHSTALGPAAGGCRMYPYTTTEDALTDVLRLSRGMTYKNAVAGLPLGGGKAVIIADPNQYQKPELLRAFSHHVQSLAGRYWTAIDIGVGPEDADVLAENCNYIFARASQYEPGFDPSAFTALGGFNGIRAAASHVFGRDNLHGLRVAIQGLGATGADLAGQLHNAGADLIVADIKDQLAEEISSRYGAVAVSPDNIHAQDVDVYAPCAMGAVVNDVTLTEIRARVVCGLANNQLAEPRHGVELQQKGIAYVPDYVVNAGGMMGASPVIFDSPSREASIKRINGLYDTIKSILQKADETGQPTSQIADQLAEARITAARH